MSGTTAARIAKRFVGLSLEQRRQFLAKLREDGKDFSLLPMPESRHDVETIPLSFAQQRLLFLWQLDPSSDAYKMSTGLRLHGQLDDSALQRSFDHLLQRHEVLRTVFATDGEQPRQVILPQLSLALERVDLGADSDAELARQVAAFNARPFDLINGPLLRAALFRLGAEEHVLVVCMHHIVSDGWSMDIMVREFAQSYQAFSQGAAPSLPALALQYADYAIWQRQWLDAGEGERQLDYWRQQLGDEQPLLEAAQDFPRPLTQSFRGERLRFDFGAALSGRLNAFARGQGMSLFMLVLAGFSLFLSRQSGQRDIRIGVPNANRGRAETEGLIGFFINTQVLRCQVDERLSYLDLLAAIRDTSLDAQAHQDVPFEQLVDQLAAERSLGHNPLFQAKFNQNVVLKQALSLKLPGLEVSEYPLHREGAHFDLALDITDDGQLIHGDMTYASDLYRRDTVEAFIPALLGLFEELLAAPRAPLYSLAAIAQPAAEEALAEAPSVLAQWQANVARQPDAIAARCLNESLTFRELDEAANRLAHHLLQQGVAQGQPVAVLMERSLPWLTALLAIFKAGAVYMPLDVKAPQERLQQMLERAKAAALLCAAGDARLSTLQVAGCANLAFDPLQWQDQPASAPAVSLAGEAPAYVIHTSGSTGQPKGVLVSHGALASYVRGLLGRLQLAPQASMALASTIAADLGHTVLFGALCDGRTLHVLPEALGFDPDGFADYMATHQVGVLKIVPGHLAALLQASRAADVLPRHALIVGGEACPVGLLQRVRELRPECRFINHYGPSETTVGVLTHEVPAAAPLPEVVPLGSALPGAVLRVLDDVFNGVAAQVPGELYIGGDSLALGYLGQAALTAERFVPDPHGAAGTRLYRSGDRVRRNRDGQLEFIGRADDQVKIRGYRVEPAEVARVLQGLATVRQAAVLALPQDDDATRLQLLAWCVAEGASAEALRQQLAQRLPDYMVPAQIVLLDQLPLTANGKLDKRALPKPGAVQQRYVAPAGEIEEKLAAIWRDVLKLEQVGSTDNFFELGGDSILSLQIIARAKRQGIKLNPKQLFEKQTIGQLATVAKLIEKKAAAPVVEQITGNLPLLPIQARFFEMDIPQRQHWNQSLLLKPAHQVDVAHLQAALHALLEQHDALRLNFVRQYAGWQAVFAPLDSAAVLWTRSTDDLDALADEAQRSLDLKSGPLLRAVLAELADGSQRLLLVVHHLVVDGVSWRVLLEDLQQAYAAIVAGRAAALPAKTSSYKAWAEKLHGYANSPALEAERDYWRAVLDGAAPDLPQDNPQGSLRIRDAAHATSRLDETLTTQLLKVAPAAYRTQVNDLLLTALAEVLCQWSGQPSVLVQLEGHGREDLFEDIDLSRTVGWFSSLFPVRLTPGASPAASIRTIKEQLRAVPAKGIGFGVLRYLGDGDFAHGLAALPQPRVTFNYLGQFDGSFDQAQAAFSLASEGSGQPLCLEGPLGNWLSVNGQVFDGQLRLEWAFSREMFRAETIEALARDYERVLRGLIEHCVADNQGVTPSDFPLAGLDQEQLDRLPLAAASIEDIYPLSPMQQGMLFHSLYAKEAGNYINQLRVSVEGLDTARLRAAWQALLDQHPVLRSGFVSAAEHPVQVVQRRVELPFVEIDARGRADLDSWLDERARLEREPGFDLAQGPLLRVALIRTDEQRFELIYTSHHILMDGWSSSRMLGEVLQRYAGQAPARQGMPYGDYIRWLQAQDGEVARRFWGEQLQAFDEPTRLALAFKGAADGEGYADFVEDLDAELSRRLGDFAREQRVTLNTLVQAAWLLLLQRYTGQSSVTFGATVAGRPTELAGIEEQLGLFINTLPVVTSPRSEQSVAAFVQQLQAQNIALREFEHTPLYEVQRWAGWSGEALFDNILVFENYPVSEALQQAASDGLVFGEVRTREQTHYPLTLVVNTGERLSLRISHDRRQFGAQAVVQLAAHFNHLLAALIVDAEAPLGSLALPADVPQALADHSSAQCIHQLIEVQAARRPDAVALSFGAQQLTYAQLNSRANQLAHKLREQGVGPDVLVGLSVERGLEMLVGVLGILKAGGAYVPLDPEYPQDRLDYLQADSGIKLLLTGADLVASALQGYSAANPLNLTSPDNLAYVIYTSGSTGKPKGALLPHHNVLRLFTATDQWFGFDENDVWSLFHSYAFDFSVWEIFGALLYGGRLVIVPRAVTRSPDDFHQLLVDEKVTVLNQTPSAFKQLARVAYESTADLALRYVVFGGEALDVGSLQPWFERFGDAQPQLINMYGITETTVHVTYRPISQSDLAQAEVSPIGAAIPDLSLQVLDSDFNPVVAGVCGELHVGHAGLARGYHHRAALTAERFVPNPFAADGSRLYRTGDLARYRAEGVIEYAGRIDHQVKIRGFRIELGEIEARLQEHAGVREVVVLAVDGPAGQQLAAYLVPSETNGDLRERLKAHLKANLPDYMVPAHLILLDAMPLTANGKLDRKALPKPDAAAAQGAYVAPVSVLEQRLATIWAEVLEVEQVGLSDNFFELGGHSLLATQVISRVRQQLDLELSLRALFEAADLAAFAAAAGQGAAVEAPAIVAVERDRPLALSHAQQRQWILWQLDPQSAAYNIPAALRLSGALDVDALRRSFAALIARHETLRTTFREDGEQAVQIVHPAGDFALPVEAVAAQQLQAIVDAEVRRPFDLEHGPLLRVRLLQLGADEHVLVLTQHHIVSDGWSMPIMVDELARLYDAFSQGQALELPALAVQYADYAQWQRDWMAAGEQARQLDYWKEQLGGEQPVLQLPTDRPRPAQRSERGARVEFELDAVQLQGLKAAARAQGVTLFMLLLAAWQTLLQRYSGQADIRVGVPVANRNRSETEGLIGFFVNTQVLKAEFAADTTVAALLQQLKATVAGAQAHQDLPFEQLVEALQPQRDLSRSPLFQVAYNHQTQAASELRQLPGLRLEAFAASKDRVQFDLTLDTYEGEQGLGAALIYATDLFDAQTVERMAAHWRNLLRAMAADASQRIADLPLQSAEETRRTLGDWNRQLRVFPGELCAHQLFEVQAARLPEAVALSFGAEQLTYAQLNTRANQLAHKLREQGVGPDVLVGLSVERSLEMLVGVLGILKAGGAYVPLDPDYPQDRLDYMQADSGIRLLLTGTDLVASALQGYSAANPLNLTSPDNLAYVIYTSGSTGKPKGALLPHRNLLRLFTATNHWFGFDENDVWTLFHSYAFDFSVWEIFGALLYGGRLVLVPRDVTRSPEDFHQLLVDENVTVLNQTPSAFKQLARVACESAADLALRYVVFGGEALDVGSLKPWFERFGDAQPQLINMYGITETTVHVTYRPISKLDLAQSEVSPIGEAIPDLSWYVLDADFNPVALGCNGELHVGHAGLARGYHNRAALTAERFVPNPFATDGSRLYRTGDLARYRAEGVIEYAGRIDHQVKIRGFRIELGEIEARLQEHEGVREVVVLAIDGAAGQQLAAWFVPRDPARTDLRDSLKAHLKANLPDYMVPTHLIALEAMPLTANGKLDRKALPKPDASQLQNAYVAPVSELEQQLAAIWAEILKVEQVGLSDNFFELGGHSLLATQVVSRIRKQLGVELSLRTLFEAADLAAFAHTVAQGAASGTPALVRVGREQPLALSYAQQRQWFLWQLDAESTAYNIPLALRLKGALDIDALEASFTSLIARHETLRTTFRQDGEQAVQIIQPATPLLLAVEEVDAAQAQQRVLEEIERPFDLQQGPLLRVRLLRLAPQEHVLVLTLHHVVADGWSLPVLVDELVRLYGGLSQGQDIQLGELPIQYADYAHWQRQWMAAGEQERQLAYWTAQLGGEQPVLELPMDRARPAIQQEAGARLGLELDGALVERLKAVAREQGVTLFMLLLASFQTLLHRHSGQDDIRVGVPVANRTRAETEGLIGFFVNTQVLKAGFAPGLTFAALLQQVKQAALQAQAHQELPFEQLVEALQPQRSLSHSPLFQVMYNHQVDVQAVSHALPGLSLEGLDLDSHRAQFDLTLNTAEHAGGISAGLVYATALFDQGTVERLAAHWLNLLHGVCADVGGAIAGLPLLGDDERGFLTEGCNQSARGYPLERGYVALFEEQVAAHPQRIAVTCLAREHSYEELNSAANRLGHALIAAGVGFDQPIALLAERGPDLLGMIVGSFKAGAGYLPLDPALPNQRLSGVIGQSGAPVLVCSAACEAQARELLAGLEGVQLLVWEQVQQASHSVANPGRYSGPDNLAYVIFTSGSTGLPKGVMVEQRGMLNNQLSKVPYLDLSEKDVIAQTASQSFDISVWQFLAAPLFGARVDIVPNDIARDPQALLAHVTQQGITVLESVPSLIQGLLAEERVNLDGLRWMLPTGEAMPPELAKQWLLRYPQIGLVNAYGPAECSDDVAFFRVDLQATESTYLPIGTPTDNNLIYLLDDALELVPLGAVGELCVAGTGVGRGYVSDTRRTVPVFVPNPFGAPGERLYRTGDLARRRADGVLEYVGRADHQVKIRGYRIELGEIETRLQEHPALREAVVLDIDGAHGKQLAAWLVPVDPQSDATTLRDTLKAALKAQLPDYMVPTHFIVLDAMPLTANGKLDRKALPQPDPSQSQALYVAPVGEREVQLAAIWAEVLKVERVGLNDDFFELGGHSLLAAQLVSRIQSGLGIDVPLRLIFEKPQLNEFIQAFESTSLSLTEDGLFDIEQMMNDMAEV
ncbi:non-ribosomal peptide synthase/polyketide synthase [Pseudomonas sp. zfem002]|uniref:non-ribosomal peptide synthase/polyketide synthase n=1 Tax=Pseudomonas sp. zfem002 TaxID=3078197 RepID=UPI00292A1562|nr:non-ribosomal peptide synthase/polyketide synthase [Pseudomonas sp. zfem002]MDU9390189.1 non-ribosomal peptide synthase/polyketide synthase [Pseudomonas sp. zfem002]